VGEGGAAQRRAERAIVERRDRLTVFHVEGLVGDSGATSGYFGTIDRRLMARTKAQGPETCEAVDDADRLVVTVVLGAFLKNWFTARLCNSYGKGDVPSAAFASYAALSTRTRA